MIFCYLIGFSIALWSYIVFIRHHWYCPLWLIEFQSDFYSCLMRSSSRVTHIYPRSDWRIFDVGLEHRYILNPLEFFPPSHSRWMLTGPNTLLQRGHGRDSTKESITFLGCNGWRTTSSFGILCVESLENHSNRGDVEGVLKRASLPWDVIH